MLRRDERARMRTVRSALIYEFDAAHAARRYEARCRRRCAGGLRYATYVARDACARAESASKCKTRHVYVASAAQRWYHDVDALMRVRRVPPMAMSDEQQRRYMRYYAAR